MFFQNVTEIINDVSELFQELIVRKPLGVFLDNAMEQHLRRNSSINFTLPMVNLLIIPSTNQIAFIFTNPDKPFSRLSTRHTDSCHERILYHFYIKKISLRIFLIKNYLS